MDGLLHNSKQIRSDIPFSSTSKQWIQRFPQCAQLLANLNGYDTRAAGVFLQSSSPRKQQQKTLMSANTGGALVLEQYSLNQSKLISQDGVSNIQKMKNSIEKSNTFVKEHQKREQSDLQTGLAKQKKIMKSLAASDGKSCKLCELSQDLCPVCAQRRSELLGNILQSSKANSSLGQKNQTSQEKSKQQQKQQRYVNTTHSDIDNNHFKSLGISTERYSGQQRNSLSTDIEDINLSSSLDFKNMDPNNQTIKTARTLQKWTQPVSDWSMIPAEQPYGSAQLSPVRKTPNQNKSKVGKDNQISKGTVLIDDLQSPSQGLFRNRVFNHKLLVKSSNKNCKQNNQSFTNGSPPINTTFSPSKYEIQYYQSLNQSNTHFSPEKTSTLKEDFNSSPTTKEQPLPVLKFKDSQGTTRETFRITPKTNRASSSQINSSSSQKGINKSIVDGITPRKWITQNVFDFRYIEESLKKYRNERFPKSFFMNNIQSRQFFSLKSQTISCSPHSQSVDFTQHLNKSSGQIYSETEEKMIQEGYSPAVKDAKNKVRRFIPQSYYKHQTTQESQERNNQNNTNNQCYYDIALNQWEIDSSQDGEDENWQFESQEIISIPNEVQERAQKATRSFRRKG